MPSQPPRLRQVIDAFQRLDRRRIAALIAEELREGPPSGDHWANVEAVANQVGEVNAAIEAAQRYALTPPPRLDRVVRYCNALASRGRIEACSGELERLPAAVQHHPAVLQLRRSLAMRMGDFAEAADLAQRMISTAPEIGQNWLALAMAHNFAPGDSELARMQALASHMRRAPAESQGPFFYALGKALHDCGEYDRAFAAYSEGAASMCAPFDKSLDERFVRRLVSDFTPEAIARLKPSACDSERAIFVTGLPRSGTTLVEQMLTSHAAVADGEEVNLFCAALMPAGDFSLQGALAYEHRAPDDADPWGDIGRDYLAMLDQRFGSAGRIVDKTLNHSRFLGLILQALPKAKVIWLRRNPEDAAISCFRAYFGTGTIPWAWSLADIGWHFRLEDALYAHWTQLYPDRILTVSYEAMVADPPSWTARMFAHVGLDPADAQTAPHLQRRAVMTASVAQVRAPISANSVGAAENYREFMGPFRDAYVG